MASDSREARQHLPRTVDGDRRRRTKTYRLNLSEDEHTALHRRAALEGVTISRLLIDSALHAKVTPGQRRAVYAALNRAAAQLGKVGGNVNQLAYWANAHQDVPAADQLGQVLAEVQQLLEDLRAAAAETVAAT